MRNTDQLRQFATQARRDAKDWLHMAVECSGDRRMRLLKYAAQREDDAEFYETQVRYGETFSEFTHNATQMEA